MWKYKRETQERAFQSRNITKKALEKNKCKHFIHKLKRGESRRENAFQAGNIIKKVSEKM